MPRALTFLLFFCLLPAVACGQNGPGESRPLEPTPALAKTLSPPMQPTDGRAEKEAPIAGRPAAEATATRPLAPTRDPQKDAWTFLIYLSAGGDLVEAAAQDLNEMEAAGWAEDVNVIVQAAGIPELGAGDASAAVRRYKIRADDDPNRLASSVVGEPANLEMGDPDSLANFVAWGRDSYPANRYALIVIERGGARFNVTDLGVALAQATGQDGRWFLDVVGFDVPLASQFELLQAVQPYARNAVASAGIFPEHGWDYTSLLRALYRESELSSPRLTSHIAADLVHTQTATGPQPSAVVAAVDLQSIPAVTEAIANLTGTLEDEAELELAARALADARRGAAIVAPAAPHEIIPHSAVNLERFASILAARSPVRETAAAARELAAAIDAALIPSDGDANLDKGLGLALSLPPRAGDVSDDGLMGERPFGAWHRLLSRSYWAADGASPPQLHVARAGEGGASVLQPAYLVAEMAGYDISALSFVAALPGGDGRLQLVAQDLIVPEPEFLPGGDAVYRWPAGVHERELVWETTVAYLTDGDDESLVVLWPTAHEDDRLAVRGRYWLSGDRSWLEAALIVDAATGEPEAVWSFSGEGESRATGRWSPRRGDAFRPYNVFLDAEGDLLFEPGITLSFDDGPLLIRRRPLPAGDARLGIVAETATGKRAASFAELAVDNDNDEEVPDAFAYLDPKDHFQFLYPAGWPVPTVRDGVLRAGNTSGDMTLTISRFRDRSEADLSELKTETLELFGAVDVLYEEAVLVSGASGLLTAYGYQGAEGARTGIFVTFVHDGVGYVVDVDGPVDREPDTIALVDRIIESWTFRPVAIEHLTGEWTKLEAGPFTVAVPEDVEHEMLDNGWQRFRSDDHFISLRHDGSSGATRQAIVERWLEVAARGVEQFMATDPTRFALAGRLWARANFEYQGREGSVRGFVAAAVIGGDEVVAWAEAPAAAFNDFEETVFLLILADAVTGMEGRGGLLYETTFDAVETWGGGQLDGAEGLVEEGVYRLTVQAPEGFFWTTAGRSFADGIYQVEAAHVEGPEDNGFGMLLRADAEAGAFYVFEISSDGFIWIGRCDDGCAQMTTLVEDGWFASEAVRRGAGVVNRLRVEALGPDLRFYVNGIEVGHVRDASLADGDVGLFVETRGEGDVSVTFDKFCITDF